jgi:3-deoxy-7-phosphoheptulonate synthase
MPQHFAQESIMTLTLTSAPEMATTAARMNAQEPLLSPRALAGEIPISADAARSVALSRQRIQSILRREDDRFLVVIGPCSIHDAEAALDYARRLQRVSARMSDRLFFVMRVYLEKPRTTVGWRGLVNDPYLDGSFEMAEGLRRARRLLTDVSEIGLPIATEMLDLSVPAYIEDLISFAGIGARTTESQPHRALASGLGCPVGFKNGTDGGLQTALDALISASRPHSYIGIDGDGRSCTMRTAGNRDGVLVLRGGRVGGPNYGAEQIAEAEQRVRGLETGAPPALIVDCSHANSRYDASGQGTVCRDVARQRRGGGQSLRGIMIESNLHAGKQPLLGDGSDRLQYGVSVTDACLGWDDTEILLGELYDTLI